MALSLSRKSLRVRGKHTRRRFIQQNPRRARIDMMKVMCQSHARHFCQRAGHLHSHRTCANEYERKQLLYGRSLGQLECSELLSLFKCQQYLRADAVGIAQGHQAGGNPRPLVVSKVVILNAGGEDKEIICYVVLLEANKALLRIDACHFAQENVDVFLAAEDGPWGA